MAPATPPPITSPLERSKTAPVATDYWLDSKQHAPPVLIGFAGSTMVRVIQELKELLLSYRGREEATDLEDFLTRAAPGIYPSLRVALISPW